MTEQPFTYPTPKPFSTNFEGYTANPDDLERWANSVTVAAVEDCSAPTTADAVPEEEFQYADVADVRHLVEVDTNYKPTRPGQHPVRLTRTAAVTFAGAVLEATEDTFHWMRCGRLRPTEAKELLEALREVEFRLTELREHALEDLFQSLKPTDDSTEPEAAQEQPADEPSTTPATGVATEPTPKAPIPAWHGTWPAGGSTFDQEFAAALDETFPGAAATIVNSDAIGALAFKVDRRCQETDETPAQVLNSLSADDRAFALRADNPAAFLASRIES